MKPDAVNRHIDSFGRCFGRSNSHLYLAYHAALTTKMLETPYVIRTIAREELNLAIAWATAEGWNPGLYDGDCFYRADSTGFWMGFLNGEPIASLSTVKYGNEFAFVGFYIVQPDYRSQGFGWQLWQTALASVQDRNLALDGVITQQENYRKSGFRMAHRNIRYAGIARGEAFPHHPGLVTLSDLPFQTVATYDRPFFPGDRTQFLHCWIQQPESTTLGLVENGDLVGYGMVRVSQMGYRVGPLFADRESVAETLFSALQSSIPGGRPIFIDVPEVNVAAIRLAERSQMSPVFETARMYTKTIPDLPCDRWFGVTSLELG